MVVTTRQERDNNGSLATGGAAGQLRNITGTLRRRDVSPRGTYANKVTSDDPDVDGIYKLKFGETVPARSSWPGRGLVQLWDSRAVLAIVSPRFFRWVREESIREASRFLQPAWAARWSHPLPAPPGPVPPAAGSTATQDEGGEAPPSHSADLNVFIVATMYW